MQVILLEKIHKLGGLGEQVNVKPGFGRNYLIPQGKAVAATKANVAAFEARRADLEAKAAAALAAAQERAAKIAELTVVISGKAGDEGKLFGSIGTRDIAEAISAKGVAVEKHEVRLPEGALRNVGEYDIALSLHSEVDTTVKLHVVAEA